EQLGGHIMDMHYAGEKTSLSALDQALIQAVYPAVPPTPGQTPVHSVRLSAGQHLIGQDFGNHKSPPLLTPPAAQQGIMEGTTTQVELGSFSEVGSKTGPWMAAVQWGDGTPATSFTVNEQGALRTMHTFANDGTYLVTVQVRDAFGSVGRMSFTL